MMEHVLITLYSVTVGMELNVLKRFYSVKERKFKPFFNLQTVTS